MMNFFYQLLFVGCLLHLSCTVAISQGISRSVISFGGSEYNSANGLTLDATMGQIAIDELIGPYTLTQGFQQGDLLNAEFPETPEIEATIFPNPFEDVLQIMIKLDAEIEMRVYDVLGQVVFTTIPQTEEMMIRTTDWATGIYFVNFTAGGKRLYVEKVIKQATN